LGIQIEGGGPRRQLGSGIQLAARQTEIEDRGG